MTESAYHPVSVVSAASMYRHTSYGLKHYLEHDTGIYVTNNAFKDAMLICGFEPADPHELNWHYCISEKSPVFKLRNTARGWYRQQLHQRL